MYCNKENVNILTSQLAAYGLRHVVVCPGSRNAPIVHNFNEHPQFECHSVTDERSAGFYAIGLSLACNDCVALCVTSGSALMNVAPAAVEALYQKLPIIVISADRPPQWIGQQDGQTMLQPMALSRYVRHSVSLPEPVSDEERWYCRRLVSECMIECRKGCGGPVHINVPISEPLFDFSTSELPQPQITDFINPRLSSIDCQPLICQIQSSKRPMLIIGQTLRQHFNVEDFNIIEKKMVVMTEPLSEVHGKRSPIDLAIKTIENENVYSPDFVLYVGDAIISKHLKRFLRENNGCKEWIANADGILYDTFTHLSGIVQARPNDVIHLIAHIFAKSNNTNIDQLYVSKWQKLIELCNNHIDNFTPTFSQMLAVKHFEEMVCRSGTDCVIHYSNSMAIRLAPFFARHHVFCNRGINGIEGSVSAACGHSLATDKRVFCVVGDLSFFYDSNALWQSELKGNLRILLLNNGGGGIFRTLKGLDKSDAAISLVGGAHNKTAEGICLQNNICYLTATNTEELREKIARLVSDNSEQPMLLEVFTDSETDKEMFTQLYRTI